ncbi:MFS transporter [Guptibacillus algicola]|uniref:MFS transporter n=1 Tax=Guptibacillus algicola TaxID=225844 RepID=UPI001CD2A9BB|nr:MFS transporter [Alkalihalobacillus algicola]MCA0988714.1 MFS transporter [Alkalihalobacillus algicola]
MYKAVFLNKTIRYYLLGGGISKLGDVLSGMAFLFLAYDLTGSKALTTGMAIAETVPYLIFGLVGGVIADWVQKKRMLILLDLLRIPLVGSVVLLYYLDGLNYLYLLSISFLIQTIGCFFNPAHRALLPLITEEDQRTVVNSLNDTLGRGVTVLSPFIAIWLLSSYGAVHFFTIDALTYAISSFCLMKVNVTEVKNASVKSVKKAIRAIGAFSKWASKHASIRNLFLFTFMIVFLNTWVWEVGLLLALSEMTTKSEEVFSMIQGVFGATVIIANSVIPFLFKRMNLGTYMIGSFIWGGGVLYYGVLYGVEHFLIGAILVGIGIPIAGLARVYILQTIVPEEMLGRGFSTNAVLLYLANTLSLALFGVLAAFVPIQSLMIGSGCLMVAASVGYLVTVKAKVRWRSSIQLFK